MKINELSRPSSKDQARLILNKSGYERISYGAFSDVYYKEGQPYILKLFSSSDVAYLDFIKMVLQHPNKHFPTIFGKIIKVTSEYYAIRLERLKGFDNSQFLWNLFEYIKHKDNIKAYMNGADFPQYLKTIYGDLVDWFELEYHESDLVKACDLIADLATKHGYKIDVLGADNVMKRDNVVVFSDPLAPPVQ